MRLLAALSGALAAASAAPHAPAFDPTRGAATWIVNPALSDEFDGPQLNTSKWLADNPVWQGRQPGLFRPSNVEVSNGELQLWARHENVATPAQQAQGYRNYTTSAVQSVAPAFNGLYEIQWTSGSSLVSSSWWFSKSNQDYPPSVPWTGWRTEIDVFEGNGNASNPMSSTLASHTHIFDSPINSSALPARCACSFGSHPSKGICTRQSLFKTGSLWSKGRHTATLHWNETHLEVFVDGVAAWSAQDHCMRAPLMMDFDRETMPDWFGVPELSGLPDRPFSIEYVRSWTRG